jgi:hypothetical protein
VNDDKTHLCQLPQERFDFPGYTFERCCSRKTGCACLGTRPSMKSIERMVDSITEETSRSRTLLETEEVVRRLNRQLAGRANYFSLGPVSHAYRAIDAHAIRPGKPALLIRPALSVSPFVLSLSKHSSNEPSTSSARTGITFIPCRINRARSTEDKVEHVQRFGDFQCSFTKGNVARLTHAADVEEGRCAMDAVARTVDVNTG